MSETHAETAREIAFVATRQIPAAEPPVRTTGAVHWAKENLFSSPLNIVLSLAAIALIAWLIPPIIRWALIDAVWHAGSLNECREISPEGACWAMIRERWLQYTFGFYPQELVWRPILAFVLMGAALAPVLFDRVPRKLLILTVLFPFIAYWLIWGGSLWYVVGIILGPVIGWLAFDAVAKIGGLLPALIVGILVTLLWWAIGVDLFDDALSAVLAISLTPVASDRLGGFLLTFIIGVTGIAASFPLGVLLALGRQSGLIFIKSVSVMFIEFIRGVPLITLLFVASTVLNYFLPPGTNFDLVLRVLIMVTLFASPTWPRWCAAPRALPRGQYEAAHALGLDYWKSMRLIILPQALKISIPGIVNTFIGLFKDTTLVIIIGLLDPLGLTTNIRASPEWNGIVVEPYVFIAAFFFIFCFGMSRYSAYLERKLETGHKR
ncbi:MAG: ABC transporter permease subunit [Rhizobiales bacterium]|nr:ABC transporter permease subunit [Hyphomicrobiales bacterium]